MLAWERQGINPSSKLNEHKVKKKPCQEKEKIKYQNINIHFQLYSSIARAFFSGGINISHMGVTYGEYRHLYPRKKH